MAMRPLKQLYGLADAESFSPLKLKAVRQLMIDDGLGLRTENMRTCCIKRMFKWAVENELVTAAVHHGLSAVGGLKQGRSDAKDPRIVGPVPEAFVEAVLPIVTRPVRALIELQQITGARSGELCITRACDIDMTGRIWIYRPRRHKNEYRQQTREIYLGLKAQEIIKPFLKPNLETYLFSPEEAREERYRDTSQPQDSRAAESGLPTQEAPQETAWGQVHDIFVPPRDRESVQAGQRTRLAPAPIASQCRDSVASGIRPGNQPHPAIGHKSVMATQI
jgi:integrase